MEANAAASNLGQATQNIYQAVVDELYEQSVLDNGQPQEFRLFDREICGGLDTSMLFGMVEDAGMSREQFDQIISLEIIPKVSDSRGNGGYLLYAERQVRTVKNLQDSGRYTTAELRHIVSKWNEKIDWSLEVVPYDREGGVEFDLYQGHIEREIEDLKRHIGSLERGHSPNLDATIRQLNEQLDGFEKTSAWMRRYSTETLPEKVKARVSRALFRLRWVNEIVRISDAEKFRSAIMQGFSPEVAFSSYESDFIGGNFQPARIDWHCTLIEFQRSRSYGARFPLRTPDFDLSEEGLELRAVLSPEEYGRVFDRWQAGELLREAQRLGRELWHPPSLSANTLICPECSTIFPRTAAKRRYCSDKCRSRAKQKRWRDRDPERARQTIARYWSNSYPEE